MENKGMPYDSDDRTVAQVNGIEPLAGKETYVTTNMKQGPTYDVFWPEGKPFGSSSGPPQTEVTIDDPVRKAMAENNANENQRYGTPSSDSPRRSSSSNKKRSSSKKPSSKSESQKRRDSKKEAIPDYEVVEVQGRGSSQKRLVSRNGAHDSSACCYCRMKARCIVTIVVIVMLLAAAGIIAGVIAATHKPPQVCNEFVKSNNKFALGAVYRRELGTSEECAEECLSDPVCGGYDFDRLKFRCFLVTGAMGPELLQNASTTDHFERQVVCNKAANPIVCRMIHSSNGNAAGGFNKGRISLEQCNSLCLMEDNCKGIDYNTESGPGGVCWVHTLTDVTKSSTCCKHYSKVCQRCSYTEGQNKISKSGQPVDNIDEPSQCGDLCNVRSDCGGFDFEYVSRTCHLVYIDTFTIIDRDSTVNYKKGACFDIQAPT